MLHIRLKIYIRWFLIMMGLRSRTNYPVIKLYNSKSPSNKVLVREKLYRICHFSHPEVRRGALRISCDVSIKANCVLDLVGDISIGSNVVFSDNVNILTHNHNFYLRHTLYEADARYGLKYSNIEIGDNVFFGINTVVLESVDRIPQGAVLAAGSVLTKNPGENEIWAGNPAKFIKRRMQ